MQTEAPKPLSVEQHLKRLAESAPAEIAPECLHQDEPHHGTQEKAENEGIQDGEPMHLIERQRGMVVFQRITHSEAFGQGETFA